jgi:transposase
VLAVDEKPAIQALERAQGYLKLPNGRALTGFAHEYKRRGTTTLFAALGAATGQIKAKNSKRRRRAEFLEFMSAVVAAYPDQEIHVVLDNLKIHKPRRDRWRAGHKNVHFHFHFHFHFTPSHASWLNQVEIWFSILSRRTLNGASFTSVRQLRQAIDAFIEAYNPTATPFQWRKATVYPKTSRHGSRIYARKH